MHVRRSALVSWTLFDWACQPFFTLVTTFVFAPYFAAALAPDPARGQAWWGYATAAAGLALAVASPVLGSIADATGRMKPWIAASCAILAVASATLWFAAPGAGYAVLLALVAFAIGTVAAEVAAVFNNAMMSRLVGPAGLGRLSGTGWAVGYAGGLVSLVIVLGFMAASPETGKTFFGLTPVLGLDPATREGDRAAGPLAALWLIAFVWPLFVFTPDAAGTGARARDAVRDGIARLRQTIGEARGRPAIARFLIGNMIYQDGLVALFAFGGIYGAGVFGWSSTELGIFGILLTVSGTVGAVIGGILDDRFGARPVILGALGVLMFVCVGILSLGREHVLFVIATEAPSDAGGLFGSVPEKAFLGLGLLIGAVAGPLQASSRAYLARTVPAEDAGRYFGLLALSGKVTSFLAPLSVAIATQVTGTQAAGPAVLVLFFAAGATLIAGIRRA
ncbi:MFS transporter [Enterovirga sp. CN4-39]|uniref:MFS transporter n=1 Tax=Enterovirga sp. CN4-39 TaxID=3400910 RepID=UPI003C04E2D1